MTRTTTPNPIRRLRAIAPARPVQVWEARRVAETQASRLRTLLGVEGPHIDTDKITALPRLDVQRTVALRASGSSAWIEGQWHIRINSGEALVRQRFTICHELKHIIDAPHAERTYRDIQDRIDGHQQIEAICDYFAACLLTPILHVAG